MRTTGPVLRKVLEQHANEIAVQLPAMDGLVLEVRRALASRIAKEDVQIQSVARALAISTRSLQRRLAAAGVTYQDLLDQTRREAANRYLRVATFSIGEVAYLLGYSEAAAFHRAFKRWTGMGPQEFRVRQREDQRSRGVMRNAMVRAGPITRTHNASCLSEVPRRTEFWGSGQRSRRRALSIRI